VTPDRFSADHQPIQGSSKLIEIERFECVVIDVHFQGRTRIFHAGKTRYQENDRARTKFCGMVRHLQPNIIFLEAQIGYDYVELPAHVHHRNSFRA
jgi:hypothetical protein